MPLCEALATEARIAAIETVETSNGDMCGNADRMIDRGVANSWGEIVMQGRFTTLSDRGFGIQHVDQNGGARLYYSKRRRILGKACRRFGVLVCLFTHCFLFL